MLSCYCFQALQAFLQGANSSTNVYTPYIQLLNSFPAWSIFASMPLSTTSTPAPCHGAGNPLLLESTPLSAETPLFSPVLLNSTEIWWSQGNYLAKSQAKRDLDVKLDCHHPDPVRTGCPKHTCVTEERCPPESRSDFWSAIASE